MERILKQFKEGLLEQLFQEQAIKIDLQNKFLLKGGIESPMFFDSGVLESSPNRGSIYSTFILTLNYAYADTDAIVGVASGGISWASSLAHSQIKPLLRAHAYPKDYGLFNQIDGEIPFDGAKVLVIDDVITSGNSALKVVEALWKGKNGKHAEIIAFASIFDWDFPAVNRKFASAGVQKMHVVSFKDVVEFGQARGYLSADTAKTLRQFYKEQN